MSTLVKRTRTWLANDSTEPSSDSDTRKEQDHEPQFDGVHDAQLQIEHQAKSYNAKIHKMKVRFVVS
jgi:hypothetical protein